MTPISCPPESAPGLSFERTRNAALITSILTHPRIYGAITDDGSPSRDQFRAVVGEPVLYLLAKHGDTVLGLWMLVPTGAVTYEAHTCLLPVAWGKMARCAVHGALDWMWRNTGARRIFTNVPAYNRLALRFAREAGMVEFGVNEKSFLKNGVLHDQIMLGVSRPEVVT